MADREKTYKALTILQLLFRCPYKATEQNAAYEAWITLYVDSLEDFSDEIIGHAMEIIRDSHGGPAFPSIAKIREACQAAAKDLGRTALPAPAEPADGQRARILRSAAGQRALSEGWAFDWVLEAKEGKMPEALDEAEQRRQVDRLIDLVGKAAGQIAEAESGDNALAKAAAQIGRAFPGRNRALREKWLDGWDEAEEPYQDPWSTLDGAIAACKAGLAAAA